jgi:hypothetical protein
MRIAPSEDPALPVIGDSEPEAGCPLGGYRDTGGTGTRPGAHGLLRDSSGGEAPRAGCRRGCQSRLRRYPPSRGLATVAAADSDPPRPADRQSPLRFIGAASGDGHGTPGPIPDRCLPVTAPSALPLHWQPSGVPVPLVAPLSVALSVPLASAP